MKTQTRMLAVAALILTGAVFGHQANAAPTVTSSYALVCPPSLDPSATNDLVNSGQSTLSSVISDGNVTVLGGALSAINDGAFGTALGMGLSPVAGATITFTLNTNSCPTGYDILQIASYGGYADGRRAYQNYDVAVHTVGSAPGTFAAVVSTGVRGFFSGGPEWTQVSVGDGNYVIAASVDQVQLMFKSGLTSPYEVDDYREIDVFGIAHYVVPFSGERVPPPATNVTPTWTYSLSAPSGDPTSSTDLVNRAQATLHPSVLFSGSADSGTSPSALNDGSFGEAWNNGQSTTNYFAPADGAVVTYSFNTAVNRRGYDLKKIVSFASYGEGRRVKQKYDVTAHYVGTAAGTFVALSSVDNLGYFSGAPEWTQVSIGDGSHVMASGVDQLRFTFHNNNNAGYEMSMYREIDVFGSPVPPSGSMIMIH